MKAFRLSVLSLATPVLVSCLLGGLTGCSRFKGAPAARDEKASAVSVPTAAAPPLADPAPTPVASAAGPMVTTPVAPPAAMAPAATMAAPSPPAKTTRAKPSKESGDDDFGGGRFKGAASAPPPSMAMPMAPVASVKAGEWDDNANYRDFQKFLGSAGVGFHRVDLRDRRFLVVRDSKGQGVPRCRVSVSDGGKVSTSFVTTASGRAIFFPHAEGFQEGKMIATADCADGRVTTTFAVGPNDPDGIVDLRLQGERKAIGTRTIDVAFVLDTTGSMAEEITAVKSTIQKVATALSNDQTQVRIGLVEYKDRTDAFVTKNYPFSTDLPGFAQKVAQISAGGGGDTPEDMNAGLHAALTQLQWSETSVARLAFVIGDAPPHLDYQDGPDYAQDMKRASHRGIQLFTVAASGMDQLGQVVFRQMAQYTGATNMFVLRGGAGPESTGGGDPGSSCGDTHTNYSSGKLDELIVQKIRRELKALDADPMRIAGLKVDENAKPCNARVAFKD